MFRRKPRNANERKILDALHEAFPQLNKFDTAINHLIKIEGANVELYMEHREDYEAIYDVLKEEADLVDDQILALLQSLSVRFNTEATNADN